MSTPYRLIEEAKERASERQDTLRLTPSDVVAKIENRNDSEDYRNGFRDYHGPRGNVMNPDR